jgi:photosystem II stability/assembly factor-like uncharacterized protein
MKNTLPILMLLSLAQVSLQAQWMKTGALPGGDVSYLLNHGDTVLARIGAELYFSANHGKTWNPVFTSPVDILRLDDSDGHSVLFRGKNPLDETTGWYRSDDFFQTVAPLTPPDTLLFYEMILAFDYLYAGGENGLYRTNDNGANWELLSTQRINTIKLQGAKLFAFNGINQMLCSVDEGITWDTLLTANGFIRDYIIPDHRIFVFTNLGCQISENGGQSWQFYPNDLNSFKFVWHNGVIYGRNDEHLIQSSDFGQTWTTVNLPSQIAWLMVSSGNTLLVGGRQAFNTPGMFRSMDGGTSWIPVSMGIRASAGKFRKIGDDLLIAGTDGLYRRQANGEIWGKEAFNIPAMNGIFWIMSDYIEINNHKIVSNGYESMVSTNGGLAWEFSQFINSNPWEDYIEQMEIIGNKVLGWGLMSGHFPQYYLSEDDGLSFERLNLGNIFAMDIDNQQAFALNGSGIIYRSDDACETWVIHSQSLPIDSCIGWHPLEARLIVRGNVFIVYTRVGSSFFSMHISLDGGQTWSSYCKEDNPSGLPWGTSEIRDLAYVGNNLVAATQKGIYVSENGGQTWEARSEGLWHRNINDLIVHDGYLWAAAVNGGVWRRPLNELELHNESETRIEREEWANALTIYPNPATGRLFIESNKEAGQLEIRDMTGRLLVQKNINAGITPLEVTLLKPGVYQVVFTGQSGGRVVRKIVIG